MKCASCKFEDIMESTPVTTTDILNCAKCKKSDDKGICNTCSIKNNLCSSCNTSMTISIESITETLNKIKQIHVNEIDALSDTCHHTRLHDKSAITTKLQVQRDKISANYYRITNLLLIGQRDFSSYKFD